MLHSAASREVSSSSNRSPRRVAAASCTVKQVHGFSFIFFFCVWLVNPCILSFREGSFFVGSDMLLHQNAWLHCKGSERIFVGEEAFHAQEPVETSWDQGVREGVPR